MNPSNGVLVDSSILIEHLRMKIKDHSSFHRLLLDYEVHFLSPVIQYEILCGNTERHHPEWMRIFEDMYLLPFDTSVAERASVIYKDLKAKSMLIDHLDILIAATALANDLPLATLNRKHFERINGLKLV